MLFLGITNLATLVPLSSDPIGAREPTVHSAQPNAHLHFSMRSICVFCGSRVGARPEYREQARNLAAALVSRGLRLVYGGANGGLMDTLAEAMLAGGGEVVGVIPDILVEREVAHEGLTELRIVTSLAERKENMASLSDAFVAIPGGLGTLDEIFEVLTWEQLGLHQKPCGLLNVCGYFDRMIEFLDHVAQERFMTERHRGLLIVAQRTDELLEKFAQYRSQPGERWM